MSIFHKAHHTVLCFGTVYGTSALRLGAVFNQWNHQQKHKNVENMALHGLWKGYFFIIGSWNKAGHHLVYLSWEHVWLTFFVDSIHVCTCSQNIIGIDFGITIFLQVGKFANKESANNEGWMCVCVWTNGKPNKINPQSLMTFSSSYVCENWPPWPWHFTQ